MAKHKLWSDTLLATVDCSPPNALFGGDIDICAISYDDRILATQFERRRREGFSRGARDNFTNLGGPSEEDEIKLLL